MPILNNNFVSSKNIDKAFGTQALPHSILVDKDGKVIMNKCPRPSYGDEAVIREVLLE